MEELNGSEIEQTVADNEKLNQNAQEELNVSPYIWEISEYNFNLQPLSSLQYAFVNMEGTTIYRTCTVSITKNTGLRLQCTLVNRNTNQTVNTVSIVNTQTHTFTLASTKTEYKLYIGNKSNVAGTISFKITVS